jgi:hypothetical protein
MLIADLPEAGPTRLVLAKTSYDQEVTCTFIGFRDQPPPPAIAAA